MVAILEPYGTVMTSLAETTAYDIRASLLIADFDCDPDELTAHLDLQPDRISRRPGGYSVPWRTGNRAARNEWLFRPAVDLPEPGAHRIGMRDLLRPLCAALETRRDRLSTLPRCSGLIRIEVKPGADTPDIALAADDLDFMNRLGLPFAIDIRTVTA